MDNDIGMIDKYIFLLKSRCNDDVIFVKCMANKVQITKYILGFWKYFRVAEKTKQYDVFRSPHFIMCLSSSFPDTNVGYITKKQIPDEVTNFKHSCRTCIPVSKVLQATFCNFLFNLTMQGDYQMTNNQIFVHNTKTSVKIIGDKML